MTKRPLRIGLSSSMMHPDPTRAIYKGKRLLFLEEQMAHYVMSQGALGYLIPSEPIKGVSLADLVAELDGIVMTGGVDVAPESYGESALKPEWAGDKLRDDYELVIIREAMRQNKPVLGICRGLQIMNVALGGTLFQDIATQLPHARVHRNWEVYDANFHEIRFDKGGALGKLYTGVNTGRINSVHHQAIKDPAKGLAIDAFSIEDDVVEGVRLKDKDLFYVGVQWHPEFHKADDATLLPSAPLLDEFMNAIRKRKS